MKKSFFLMSCLSFGVLWSAENFVPRTPEEIVQEWEEAEINYIGEYKIAAQKMPEVTETFALFQQAIKENGGHFNLVQDPESGAFIRAQRLFEVLKQKMKKNSSVIEIEQNYSMRVARLALEFQGKLIDDLVKKSGEKIEYLTTIRGRELNEMVGQGISGMLKMRYKKLK